MSDEFIMFPRDCLIFSLKCKWCGKCVSPPESIGTTLFNAPYAKLSHLKMMFLVDDHNSIMEEDNHNIQLESFQFSSHLTSVIASL